MVEFLYDDQFTIKKQDPDGKKFDRVSRIVCESENYRSDLLLDVHSQLFELETGGRFFLGLASSLNPDSMNVDDKNAYDAFKMDKVLDQYDYVMHGRVYKFEEASNDKVAVYISYGGLLMRLESDPKHLSELSMDLSVFLLIKYIK